MKKQQTIKLHNTQTRQTEPLSPLNPPQVTLYTCGPTVYQDPHIGNWRTFVFYDSLVRALKVFDYQPKWVMNITDVGHLVSDEDEGEDKLAKTAAEERKTAWEVAEYYTKGFLDGLEALNITKPDQLPRATDHITEQIELVERLEAKSYTYRITDGVYFDTSKLKDYGKLAGLSNVEQLAGARVETNPEKKQPADFALWKFTPADQKRDMEWDSPWGKGFPGWHLECSAMAMKYLGETIDIHAGGVDHINVHHTNEIAQSEAATGKDYARCWLHGEFMLVNGQKMSKSLGNVHTLEAVTERGFTPLELRFRFLQSHYRSELNFTWETLSAAKTALQTIHMMADRQFFDTQLNQEGKEGSNLMESLEATLDGIRSSLAQDLNTPAAISTLLKFADHINTHPITEQEQEGFLEFLDEIDQLFGLSLLKRSNINAAQVKLITERDQARQDGDFENADRLRNQLVDDGIILNDTPFGTYWYRTN